MTADQQIGLDLVLSKTAVTGRCGCVGLANELIQVNLGADTSGGHSILDTTIRSAAHARRVGLLNRQPACVGGLVDPCEDVDPALGVNAGALAGAVASLIPPGRSKVAHMAVACQNSSQILHSPSCKHICVCTGHFQ